jgi:hypothetical protein
LPRRMLWTERIFQLFPIGKEHGSFASFLTLRLIRSLCFAFIFVLIGVLGWMFSGITTHAYDELGITAPLYFLAVTFLVFVVSGWFHNKWSWFFNWSSHILKLSETEFGKFRDRMEKFTSSFYACLIIALIVFVIGVIPAMSLVNQGIGSAVLRPAVLVVWLASTNFFICLLTGTLLWMIVSMWITFYVTLRQPLKLKLSHRTDEEFRPLAIWSLKVLFVSFVLVTIVVVFKNLGVLVVPGGFVGYAGTLTFLLTLGVLAFLLPFYHVHRVLLKLKKQELLEIEEEHDKIIQDLPGTTSMQEASDKEAHMMHLIHSIISLEVLHMRERRAKDADD